jgi:heme o synthase
VVNLQIKTKITKYIELTKPKVTLLNLLVGVACFFLASFPTIDPVRLGLFTIVGYIASGGCGVINSVYDKDIDLLMQRTAKRAIPSGAIKAQSASTIGLTMIVGGILAAYFYLNMLTALMIALGAVFYLVIYTFWLKRVSPWNVVIGGFAGCFAALSGWTAAVNMLSLMPLLIAMLDFLWTPGHLWGLAIKKVNEYRYAGVPMLPVKIGVLRTGRVVFLLNVITVTFSLLFFFMGVSGLIFLVAALGGGAWFLFQGRGLISQPSSDWGFRAFIASMPYLACLMLGLMLDKIMLI